MKKCNKSRESCSEFNPDPAEINRKNKDKSKKTLKSEYSKMKRMNMIPNAPHNTTEYLMKLHKIKDFDPEELLGENLGITANIKLRVQHTIN